MKMRRHTPEQVVRKLREADKTLAEDRRIDHNRNRPHSVLGSQPPELVATEENKPDPSLKLAPN